MNKDEILKIVEDYVKNICENESTGHDWWHIKRVYKIGMLINKNEKADEFILTMIILMHDLYDHKFYKGNAEEKLKETMKELNIIQYLSESEIENIVYSCVNLGFSSNFDTKKELSKEGQIAQDADRLDGLGAMGIARTFAYCGKVGRPLYDSNNNKNIDAEEYRKKGSRTGINHFYDKILKLKDLMNTKTAKEIAIERHKFVENFLNEFLDEWDGKR